MSRLRRIRFSLLARFGILSLLAFAVLGAILAQQLSANLREKALEDARTIATLTTSLQLKPELERDDLDRPLTPERIERLDQVLRAGLMGITVTRIKLWSREGEIVYSDDRSLVGERVPVDGELAEALGGEVVSEVSHSHAGDAEGNADLGDVVEVYAPLRWGAEKPVGAFEIYVPYADVSARVQSERNRVLVMVLGGLVILWAILFRLVAGASRRLTRQARENEHQAMHDALTGLPNRTAFTRALEAAVRSGEPLSVLLLDLDRFKEINDTLGHETGDELLRQVGVRLASLVPPASTVARLGGDEFAVLCGNDVVHDLAARLTEDLAEPFELETMTVHTEPSIGMASFPEHALAAADLLQRADVAMYQAKREHAGVCVYSAEQDPYDPERLALVGELRRAIAEDQLVLHFQPKIDLRTGRTTGAEALVRWNHPTRGLLPPVAFVDLAEHTSLIRPLTLWVLEEALRQCREWRDGGMDLSVAVNLSAANLLDLGLPNDIAALLARLRLPPCALELEITESLVMTDPVRAGEVLGVLHSMRVGLSVDDYGTGHSSLSYLRRLPVRELKIDRSFVTDMLDDHHDVAIVRSTIELAHSLGLRVVAEGVETGVVQAALQSLGCDIAQGYHIARPMPGPEFAPWATAHAEQDPPWKATIAEPGSLAHSASVRVT